LLIYIPNHYQNLLKHSDEDNLPFLSILTE
jgi:hypothetical protein